MEVAPGKILEGPIRGAQSTTRRARVKRRFQRNKKSTLGGPWGPRRPLEAPDGRPLETLGDPWRPLETPEAPGGPWRPRRPLEPPGDPRVKKIDPWRPGMVDPKILKSGFNPRNRPLFCAEFDGTIHLVDSLARSLYLEGHILTFLL